MGFGGSCIVVSILMKKLWICLLSLLFLSGCAGLKKTAIVAAASSIGAGVGSVVSGSVGAVAGAAPAATAGVLATGLSKKMESPSEIIAETVVTHAPTNIWDVVSNLGMWGALLLLIPLALGILLPGPVKFKGTKKRR